MPGRAGLAGGAHDLAQLLGAVRDARAGSAPSRRGRSRRRRRAPSPPCSRWRGCAVEGSVRFQTSSSTRRDRERHRHGGALRGFDEHVEIAHDHRPARDDRERIRRVAQHLEAGARELVLALGGLVRIGRGADRDVLALPRRTRELLAQARPRRSSSRGSTCRSGRPTAGRSDARNAGRNRTCSGGRSPCTGSGTT